MPLQLIPAKTLITRTKKPAAWFGAEYNMNIYRGCNHGCVYCDSRSECYKNPDFDSVKAKGDALLIIRDELRRKTMRGVISTGAMSDPYNAFESEERLTGNALELINAYRFGVAIDTKGTLVTRDISVLQDIMSHSPVIVKMTITTCDDDLAKIIEPNAACPKDRFGAIRTLSEAGIFCGVLMMPLLPHICDSDDNVAELLRQTKDAGAKFVYPSFGMTLRQGNREYYYKKLDEHFPMLRQKYEAEYGGRYVCTSPRARRLLALFSRLCEEYGLLHDMRGITFAYRRGYVTRQVSLFDILSRE